LLQSDIEKKINEKLCDPNPIVS